MESDLNVKIDLNNLEDVKFEGSKYVLTSPRSLEACSRLNVKPVELLYRPLSEFQEELIPQDIPLRTIYAVFDECEQIRQEKLKLCREERRRIINADKQKMVRVADETGFSDYPYQNFEQDYGTLKKTMNQSPRSYKSSFKGRNLQGSVDNESLKLHRELLSKKERHMTQGEKLKARPQSADGRKTQRCGSSVITGKKARHRIGSAPNIAYKLPARDAKILKLMEERRESEIRDLELREQAHRLWEDQKQKEKAIKSVSEKRRRELLAGENRIKDMLRAEAEERRARQEDIERELLKLDIHDSQIRGESVLMNQLRMKELQISDKIKKEALMKGMQETNIKTKMMEDEEKKQLLLAKQIHNQNSANERKERKIHQEGLKKFLENRQEREGFEKRHRYLKGQQEESSALIRSSMTQRLNKASRNLSQILEQRNQHLAEHHQEEQVKLYRAQNTHKKLEAEMEAWRSDLLQHEKLMEERASEAVNRSIELKSLQARKNRMVKELEQKKNISRLRKEDEKYRRNLQRSLLQKDSKIEDMKDYNERIVSRTRAMAQLSQALRDDIKGKYDSDTFDKKVLEAKLYANLYREHRVKSPVPKSNSTVKIY